MEKVEQTTCMGMGPQCLERVNPLKHWPSGNWKASSFPLVGSLVHRAHGRADEDRTQQTGHEEALAAHPTILHSLKTCVDSPSGQTHPFQDSQLKKKKKKKSSGITESQRCMHTMKRRKQEELTFRNKVNRKYSEASIIYVFQEGSNQSIKQY